MKKINDNRELYNWRDKGLITKCKDFFTVNIDDKIYQNNAQILGCIDALKIILAITEEQIKTSIDEKEIITQLVDIVDKYEFSENRELVLKINDNYSIPKIIGIFGELNDPLLSKSPKENKLCCKCLTEICSIY